MFSPINGTNPTSGSIINPFTTSSSSSSGSRSTAAAAAAAVKIDTSGGHHRVFTSSPIITNKKLLLTSEYDSINSKNKTQLQEICKDKNIKYKKSENKKELVIKVCANFRHENSVTPKINYENLDSDNEEAGEKCYGDGAITSNNGGAVNCFSPIMVVPSLLSSSKRIISANDDDDDDDGDDDYDDDGNDDDGDDGDDGDGDGISMCGNVNDNNGDDELCGDINYEFNLSDYYSHDLISWYNDNVMLLPMNQQRIGLR